MIQDKKADHYKKKRVSQLRYYTWCDEPQGFIELFEFSEAFSFKEPTKWEREFSTFYSFEYLMLVRIICKNYLSGSSAISQDY